MRGLPTAARCPECGLRVKLSLTWDLLRCSDPRWVRALVRGFDLMLAGFAVFAAGFFAMIGAQVAGLERYAVGVWLVGVVVGFGAYLVGTWISTRPDPSGLGDELRSSRFLRRFVRGVAAILFAWLCLALRPARSLTMTTGVEVVTTGGAWVLAAVGFLAQLHFLQGLAVRNERWDLAGRAFMLKWLVTLTYGPWLVGFAIALVLNLYDLAPLFVCSGVGLFVLSLVYATMYLALLARLRRDMKEEADLATREAAEVGSA